MCVCVGAAPLFLLPTTVRGNRRGGTFFWPRPLTFPHPAPFKGAIRCAHFQNASRVRSTSATPATPLAFPASTHPAQTLFITRNISASQLLHSRVYSMVISIDFNAFLILTIGSSSETKTKRETKRRGKKYETHDENSQRSLGHKCEAGQLEGRRETDSAEGEWGRGRRWGRKKRKRSPRKGISREWTRVSLPSDRRTAS